MVVQAPDMRFDNIRGEDVVFMQVMKNRDTTFDLASDRAKALACTIIVLAKTGGSGNETYPIMGFNPQGDFFEILVPALRSDIKSLASEAYFEALSEQTFYGKAEGTTENVKRYKRASRRLNGLAMLGAMVGRAEAALAEEAKLKRAN